MDRFYLATSVRVAKEHIDKEQRQVAEAYEQSRAGSSSASEDFSGPRGKKVQRIFARVDAGTCSDKEKLCIQQKKLVSRQTVFLLPIGEWKN